MTTVLKYRTNLNCGSCVAAVKPHLDGDAAIARWSVDTADPNKVLTVEGEHLSKSDIARHVADAGFQVLGELEPTASPPVSAPKSFWQTYQPLLLVVGYLLGIVAVVEITAGSWDMMRAMGHFMGGFFLAFSFFKLLDLRGFVDSYQTYDVLARQVRGYGYAYPFIELGLGVAYLLGIAPVVVNWVTLIVMLIGIVGVSQALWQKRQIQCACLGTVFNLPMSKVTFIEDGVMAAMAAGMLWSLLA